MTRYVYDDARRAIVRLELQVPEPVAEDVCVLSPEESVDGVALVGVLGRLVDELWWVHDRPGGAGEFEREELERMRDALELAFVDVLSLSEPFDAPAGDAGDLGDPEIEALDALARGSWDELPTVSGIDLRSVLRDLDDLLPAAPVRDAVVGEVARQAVAVRKARLGDYSGDASVGAWRERGYVEPLLLASALRTVGSLLEGGWYPSPERARELLEQVGVDAAAAALGELVHVAVHETADALGYRNVNELLIDADAYEAIDLSLVAELAAGASGATAVAQLLDDAAHLRRGEVTPAIMTRIDRQSEQVRELASRLDPDDDRTRETLDAEALAAVPLPPGAVAAGIVTESLDVCDALLAVFSNEEDDATEEMLADEGMSEPDPEDHEAYAAWETEVQGRTTASWLTMLSMAWGDRQP